MNVVTIRPRAERSVVTNTGRGTVVSMSDTKQEDVVVLGGGETFAAVLNNETMQSVLRAPWKSPRALVMCIAAVVFTQPTVDIAEQIVSRTDDDGLVLEFIARGNERELLYAVPQDGTAMYFVAHDHKQRRAGVVDGPQGVVQLAAWLNGGSFPAEHVHVG